MKEKTVYLCDYCGLEDEDRAYVEKHESFCKIADEEIKETNKAIKEFWAPYD
jgi:hypothetical protein